MTQPNYSTIKPTTILPRQISFRPSTSVYRSSQHFGMLFDQACEQNNPICALSTKPLPTKNLETHLANPVLQPNDAVIAPLMKLPFFDEILLANQPKPQKRRQRRG